MKLRTFLAPVLILLTLGLTACGGNGDNSSATAGGGSSVTTTKPGGNAAAPSGDAVRSAKVEIADFAYDPDPVTVEVGGKVIWLNQDSAPHTASAKDGSFDTGTLQQGKLKSETFKTAGTYTYVCQIHPFMHGSTVVVVED
jgi:plastocyanin